MRLGRRGSELVRAFADFCMSRPSELSHRRSTGYASPGQGYPPDRRHRRADRVYQVDTRSLRGNALFRPLNGYASTQRHNFDGWMSSSSDNGLSNSYAQLFRDGSIETVDARMLHPEGRSIPIDLLETEVIDVVSKYLALLGQLGVDPPIVLMLTLMGVQGYTIPPPNAWGLKHPIDRDVLLVPAVEVERLDLDVPHVLRPAFDAIWQAGGYPGSQNYDENGTRRA